MLSLFRKAVFLWTLLFTSFSTLALEKISLDGIWSFKTDPYDLGLVEEWYGKDHSYEKWGEMQVPGNWDIEPPYADYTGVAWYKTEFDTPKKLKSKLTRIVFESVYNNSVVWINGQEIGKNDLGFLPFQFDINQYLNKRGKNTLVVRVDNVFKRGAIWNWGGIRRPVWLEITDLTRIEKQHIVATPDLDKGTADIDIKSYFSRTKSPKGEYSYVLEVAKKSAPDTIIASKSGNIQFGEQSEIVIENAISLSADLVDLWGFNHPNLYHAKLKLIKNGKVTQEQFDRFGIRKLEIRSHELVLNGDVIRPLGLNLVPEDRYSGNTLPLYRIKEDIALMKSLGANFQRVSHMPLPKAYLDLFDENGIMTIEEVSLWGRDPWVHPDHPMPKIWLERMIETRYNHPSIIGWSVGNEIGKVEANPHVYEYVKGAIAHTKRIDPSRMAIYVSHSTHISENDAAVFSDMIMYNIYRNWGENLEKSHKNFPDKAIFMTEYGSGLNHETLNKGTFDAKGLIDKLRNKPYNAGGAVWTLNDYRSKWYSRPGWNTAPSQNRAWGLVNAYRQKKRAYYLFRTEHAPITNISFAIDAEENSAQFNFNSKTGLDLPVYKLDGYSLQWTAFDTNGKVVESKTKPLPLIDPDGKAHSFKWSFKGSPARVSVDLVDGIGYSLYDEYQDLRSPDPLKNVKIYRGSVENRIVFEPSWNTDEVYVEYELNGKTIKDSTIENYIQLTAVDATVRPRVFLAPYDVTVIAKNKFGETRHPKKLTVEISDLDMPPVVFDVQTGNDAIYIGYNTTLWDYLYEIELGRESGEYQQKLTFNTKGSYKIPNLEPGDYYFRMRSRWEHGYPSVWTDEFHVEVGGEDSLDMEYDIKY